LLAALTLMNMLIGVICEVVSAVAATERESMNLAYVKDRIKALLLTGDDNIDQLISKKEFMTMLGNKQAAFILGEVGVDVIGLVDFADTIFAKDIGEEDHLADDDDHEVTERSLTFAEFMNLILDLRGSNGATVKDIIELRKHMNSRLSVLEERVLDALQGDSRTARRNSVAFARRQSRKTSQRCGSPMSPDATRASTKTSTTSSPYFGCASPTSQLHEGNGARLNTGVPKDLSMEQDISQQLRIAMDEAVSKLLLAQAHEITSLKAEVQQLRIADAERQPSPLMQRPRIQEAAPEPVRCPATCRSPVSSQSMRNFRQLQQAHDRPAPQFGGGSRPFAALLPEPQNSSNGASSTTVDSERSQSRSWPGGFFKEADDQEVQPDSGDQRHPVAELPGAAQKWNVSARSLI